MDAKKRKHMEAMLAHQEAEAGQRKTVWACKTTFCGPLGDSSRKDLIMEIMADPIIAATKEAAVDWAKNAMKEEDDANWRPTEPSKDGGMEWWGSDDPWAFDTLSDVVVMIWPVELVTD